MSKVRVYEVAKELGLEQKVAGRSHPVNGVRRRPQPHELGRARARRTGAPAPREAKEPVGRRRAHSRRRGQAPLGRPTREVRSCGAASAGLTSVGGRCFARARFVAAQRLPTSPRRHPLRRMSHRLPASPSREKLASRSAGPAPRGPRPRPEPSPRVPPMTSAHPLRLLRPNRRPPLRRVKRPLRAPKFPSRLPRRSSPIRHLPQHARRALRARRAPVSKPGPVGRAFPCPLPRPHDPPELRFRAAFNTIRAPPRTPAPHRVATCARAERCPVARWAGPVA